MKYDNVTVPAEVKELEQQGVPVQDIGTPIGASVFILEDSGEKVVMRKPMISDLLAVQEDKSVESGTEEILAVIAMVSTFDGKPRNWHDISKTMSIMDYNELSLAYSELTKPKKMKGVL